VFARRKRDGGATIRRVQLLGDLRRRGALSVGHRVGRRRRIAGIPEGRAYGVPGRIDDRTNGEDGDHQTDAANRVHHALRQEARNRGGEVGGDPRVDVLAGQR